MKTVYLIGPPEPSGLSWLYNCFLCLDIKVSIARPINQGVMWLKSDESYVLNPLADIQKKWAPILSKKSSFSFKSDLEIRYGHEWPTGWQRNQTVIFFIRHPFDALFSSWQRNGNAITFEEYLRVPNHLSLLNKVDNWNLFCEAWLGQRETSNLHLVRFEDYRKNAEKTLREVLNFLDVSYSNKAISYAISESSYEKASQAEEKYVPSMPGWLKVCDDFFWRFYNRKVNQGSKKQKSSYLNSAGHKMILSRTSYVCNEFRYSKIEKPQSHQYYPQKAMLSFYNHLDFGDEWRADQQFVITDHLDEIENIFQYIRNVDSLLSLGKRAGLMFGEIAALVNALQEFKGNYLEHVQK